VRNRRGAYTVQIVLLFGGMLVLVYAVIAAAGKLAVFSSAEHFGRLWGTSILAEYDLNLKDRYGLFGFYGNETMVENKLDYYARYTFSGKSYIEYGGTVCSLDGFSLANPELVKAQMAEAVLFGSRPHGLVREMPGEFGGADFGYRRITSRWILDSLPSAADSGNWDVTSLVSSIKNGKGFSSLVGASSVNQYIFTYFQHNQSTAGLGETYFRNEIEYILCGKTDDEAARKAVRRKLVTMRNMLNLAWLYSSPEKRELAMALASALTPGPEAVITQGILLELWAYAEAENDMRILEAGQTVPLTKSEATWALTLENAMASAEESPADGAAGIDFIAPPVMEGQNYGEYLRMLLSAVPEKTRILRAMDLVQINMKYLYCDYFLLKDYYTGLSFSMEVNGVKHEFTETYERTEQETGEETGQLPG